VGRTGKPKTKRGLVAHVGGSRRSKEAMATSLATFRGNQWPRMFPRRMSVLAEAARILRTAP
jgi:hypothetical protein